MEENGKKRKADTSPIEGQPFTRSQRRRKRATKHKEEKRQVNSSESSDDDRNRTPSGTVIKKKVHDIRDFLEKANKLKDIGLSRQIVQNQSTGKKTSTKNSATISTSVNTINNMGDHGKSVNSARPLETNSEDKLQSSDGEQFHSPRTNMSTNVSTANSELDQSSDQEESDETKFLKSLAVIIQNKGEDAMQIEETDSASLSESQTKGCESEALENSEQQQSVIEKVEMELNNDDTPKAMSLQAVMQMFQEIKENQKKESMELKKSMGLMKTECVKEAKTAVAKEMDRIQNIESEVAYWKLKSEVLTEVCTRMNTEIKDLTTRMDNMEFNGSKKKALMSGLRLEGENKGQKLAFINDFLQFYLGEEVIVDDYFALGHPEQLQTVLIFQSIEERKNVLRLKQNLKEYRNEEGRKVYISEYLPSTSLEKKKKEKAIHEKYQEIGEAEAISYVKGQIRINQQPYSKIVNPPTPKQLVDISTEKLQQILSLRPKRSSRITQDQSEFMAYVSDVGSFEQIMDLYIRAKLIQPEARHIVCAYTLDDETIEECYKQDYHDDGEPAAGRSLLNILNHYGIRNKVIFVARKYGGIRMGSNRFSCYVQAACEALEVEIPERTQNPVRSNPTQYSTGVKRNGIAQKIESEQQNEVPKGADKTQKENGRRFQRGISNRSQRNSFRPYRGTHHTRRGAYPPGVHKSPYHHSHTYPVRGSRPHSTQYTTRMTQPRRQAYRSSYENRDYGDYEPDYELEFEECGMSNFKFSRPWENRYQ